jgi:hypothetical protein
MPSPGPRSSPVPGSRRRGLLFPFVALLPPRWRAARTPPGTSAGCSSSPSVPASRCTAVAAADVDAGADAEAEAEAGAGAGASACPSRVLLGLGHDAFGRWRSPPARSGPTDRRPGYLRAPPCPRRVRWCCGITGVGSWASAVRPACVDGGTRPVGRRHRRRPYRRAPPRPRRVVRGRAGVHPYVGEVGAEPGLHVGARTGIERLAAERTGSGTAPRRPGGRARWCPQGHPVGCPAWPTHRTS